MAKVISSIAVLRNEMVLFVYCRKLNCNQQTPVTETQWRCETQVTVFLAEEVEGKADNLNGESFFFFFISSPGIANGFSYNNSKHRLCD